MVHWLNGTVHFFMQYGSVGLFVLSFVEASFIPLPPFLLQIPMTLAKPQLGLFYALIGTIGSVLGGLFGYLLGFRLGRPLLVKFIKPAALEKLESFYQRWGDWATAAGGLTPLPYKIFAISAGVFRNRLATFIPTSIVVRSFRFFGEALLVMLYGRKVVHFFETTLGPATLLILGTLSIVTFLLYKSGLLSKNLLLFFQHMRGRWLQWVARLQRRFFPVGMFSWSLITGATLTVFGFIFFSKLASELLENELIHFDLQVSQWISSYRTIWLTKIMLVITNLASTGFVIGSISLVTIVGVRLRKRIEVIVFNLAIVGALLFTELLKRVFERNRPDLPWLAKAYGYSFPSGHTLISMTLFGFLAYLVFRSVARKFWKYTFTAGLLFIPILVGISRVYLGVHYPTDVLAGWAVAIGWVGTCMAGMEYLSSRKKIDVKNEGTID